MLERFLKQLIADLEFEGLPHRDERGNFQFRLNPQLTILIKELDPGLYFSAQISRCPTKKREELFSFLMQANLLGQGTGGNTIGLDEDEKFLTLSSHLPYDMNYKTFKESLGDFANYVDYWREEIKRYET